MVRTRTDELLLGEWACLGLLAQAPAHGYDVAGRLAPSGDVGRVWSLSRPLTYRALDQLVQRDLVTAIGEERGRAGGNRDVRSVLLLKLVLCEQAGVDASPLLHSQRALFEPLVAALARAGGPRHATSDPVAVWRYESSRATLRFLDRLIAR